MSHPTDLDLTAKDVAELASPDAITALLTKLGYNTANRTLLSPEAVGLAGESANAIKRIELLSEDPEQFLPFFDDDCDDHLKRLRCRGAGWLDEMIRSLPEGYKEAVQLSEIEGLPQQEVANRLGLSLSGAKSRIQRGRVMLKDVLDKCCHFEFDGVGNLMDYEPKPDRKVCRDCVE